MTAVFAILMIALAVLGFAYAQWNEILTINGTITTGELDVEFTVCKTNDPPDGVSKDPSECGSWDGETWIGGRYDLDVASIDCELVVEDTGLEAGDKQKIDITVENAYSSYHGNVMFTIENIGTIPAKIKSIKLVAIGGSPITPIDLVACTPVKIDADNDGDKDLSLHLSTLAVGDVIPLPKGSSIPGDLCIHVLDGADELDSYSFTIEIEVGQFNA